MKNHWKNLLCWWFGCKAGEPVYDSCEYIGWIHPCLRCGADDVSYGDMVGDTRHNRLMEWLKHWLFWRWYMRILPAKCSECGRRGCDDFDHQLPF